MIVSGYAIDGQCIRDPVQAAAAYCSAVSGVTAAGVASCTSASLDPATGVLTWALAVDDAASQATRTLTMSPPQCVPFDMEEYSPVVAAWVLLLVVVLCARLIVAPLMFGAKGE